MVAVKIKYGWIIPMVRLAMVRSKMLKWGTWPFFNYFFLSR